MTDNNDDEFYDDALDESFELEDEDYDEVDLDADYDDFDDPFGEDSDDDIEGDDEQFGDEIVPMKEKKSFITFDRIIILGAVIIGVFVMLGQVKSKSGEDEQASNNVEQFATALTMEGAFDGPGSIEKENLSSKSDKKEKEQESEIQKGFLFGDSDQDNALDTVIEDAPPMPNPIAADVVDQVMEQVAEDDSLDNLMNQEIQVEAQNIVDTPRPPEVQEIVDVVVEDAKFEDVPEVPVETLQEAIEEVSIIDVAMDSQKLLPPPTEAVVVASVPMAINESLSAKLDQIINRIDGVEARINNFQKTNDNNIAAMKRDIESLRIGARDVKVQTVTELPIASLSPAPIVEKIAPPKKVSKPKPKKKTVKKVNRKISWELRAAQPGKAWVSRKGQKTSMKPIVVGDRLDGLGRVTNIAYVGGKWVVTGTFGTIRQ